MGGWVVLLQCKWEFHQQNMAQLGLSTYYLVNQYSLNLCHIIFCPDKVNKNAISLKLFIKLHTQIVT